MKSENNQPRVFDAVAIETLGKYVYVLRDPRDKKVFYVGQGTENRVHEHFDAADKYFPPKSLSEWPSSKIMRIIDIWNGDEDVEWSIISYGLTQTEADLIESSVIDSLGESQNGRPLNDYKGPNSKMLSSEDVKTISAVPINIAQPYNKIFIFPIHNQLEAGLNIYDATRRFWRINAQNRTAPCGIAVGVSRSICRGAFDLQSWNSLNGGKYEFVGNQINLFANTNWRPVIQKAMGFFQRGNYLIIETNGQNQFRFLYGNANKTTWHSF